MNNVLFTVTNLDLIPSLKERKVKNFVYPLSFFCVGIPHTFTLDEIKEENSFLYVNKNLDTNDISKLDKILHSLNSNIKGIIFEDIGVIEITKDLNIKKILFGNHFLTNYESINEYLNYVDDVIISSDITINEIDEIISHANKKVSVMAFGLISSLYSRRELLLNHSIHYNIPKENNKNLYINDKKFIAIENEFGTVIYHYPYFNGDSLLEKDIHYAFYFPILLDKKQILDVLDKKFDDIETDEGFLNTKTIYKVKNN